MKIVIMGAGAIGSFFGGLLSEKGNDVTLIARPTHVNVIKEKGLTIRTKSGKHNIKIKAVSTTSDLHEKFELIILTVKAYDTQQAIIEIKKLMENNSVLLCLQNGIGIEEVASKIISKDKIIRGITSNGVLLKSPGTIIHTGQGETVIGKINGKITSRIQKIAELISEVNLPIKITENIREKVWIKTLINAGINPFGALTRLKNGELISNHYLKKIMIETVLEGNQVAKKFDIELEEDPVSLMIKTAKMTSNNKNSMLQDMEKGRKTEIDYINGAISKLGEKKGVKTPLNILLTNLIKGLELKHAKERPT